MRKKEMDAKAICEALIAHLGNRIGLLPIKDDTQAVYVEEARCYLDAFRRSGVIPEGAGVSVVIRNGSLEIGPTWHGEPGPEYEWFMARYKEMQSTPIAG